MPIPALAIMFSPHVRLNSSADRFTASIGPTCSITSTGSTRNVTSDHASPTSAPMIRPRMPERSSIARSTSDTVALEHRPRQQHVRARARGVHGFADRHGLAAEAAVGREHERGVEEHDDVGDRDVADDAEDPRERLRRSLRAAVGDERDRPEEHQRDDERRQAREQRQHGELLVVAQHVPRRLRELDRVLQPSHGGPSSDGRTDGQGTACRARHP